MGKLSSRRSDTEEGAPAWFVTYGDMTGLLLCFFVFLVTTMDLKKDSMAKASGYFSQRLGVLPESTSAVKTGEMDSTRGQKKDKAETQSIDEGKKFVMGGKTAFEKNQATPMLTPEATESLLDFANQIRGLRNIIEVRGHTGLDEGVGGKSRDAMDLSLERARAIRDFLVNSGNIPETRMRIVGCANYERLKSSLFITTEEQNRRVEIRVTEKYSDFTPDSSTK